jgi:hypothetical protein
MRGVTGIQILNYDRLSVVDNPIPNIQGHNNTIYLLVNEGLIPSNVVEPQNLHKAEAYSFLK